jgi:hypothetical protein
MTVSLAFARDLLYVRNLVFPTGDVDQRVVACFRYQNTENVEARRRASRAGRCWCEFPTQGFELYVSKLRCSVIMVLIFA